MARLFPFRSETPSQDGAPRIVDLEGEDADAVFSALSSTTARQIYARLDEEPGTPSDVADAIDSSIQNVRYHLEKLEDAGLVEVVDTWYSSRGNEMSVYATTDGPLIVTSDESTGTQLKAAISRLIGAVGALASGSLMVQYGVSRWFDPAATGTTEDAPAAADGDPEPYAADDGDDAEADDVEADDAEPADDEAADELGITEADPDDDADAADDVEEDEVDTEAGDDAAGFDEDADADPAADAAPDVEPEMVDAALSIPPGLLFFLGGLVVLLAVAAYWYWFRPTY